MPTQQNHPEIIMSYDLNDLGQEVGRPTAAVREAIKPVIETLTDDESRFSDIYHGVGEIIKDVELHGDALKPRLVIVKRELGGLAIDTINKIKELTTINGFGRLYINLAFGDNYYSEIDGDIFKSHVFIPSENSSWQYPKIEHVA